MHCIQDLFVSLKMLPTHWLVQYILGIKSVSLVFSAQPYFVLAEYSQILPTHVRWIPRNPKILIGSVVTQVFLTDKSKSNPHLRWKSLSISSNFSICQYWTRLLRVAPFYLFRKNQWSIRVGTYMSF